MAKEYTMTRTETKGTKDTISMKNVREKGYFIGKMAQKSMMEMFGMGVCMDLVRLMTKMK